MKEDRRELVPSAAALNARIVSSGLSMRLRVGLDRSGSAVANVSMRVMSRTATDESDLSRCRPHLCASSTVNLPQLAVLVLAPLRGWLVG